MPKIKTSATAVALGMFCASMANAADFGLSSPNVKDGGTIPEEQVANVFGCASRNISPALAWKDAPAATKSFALTLYDLDAPTGSGFWHWVVFNIPATATSLPKNAGNPTANLMPAGAVQGRTDFGVPGYGGPCPRPKDKPHHYRFTLFALDIDKINGVDANTPAAVIGFNLHFHTLATARIVATYGR